MRPEPTRLVESEGRLGEALRRLPQPPLLTDDQIDRVQLAVATIGTTSLLAWLLAKSAPLKLFVFAGAVAVGGMTTRAVIEEVRAERTPKPRFALAVSPHVPQVNLATAAAPVVEEVPPVVEPAAAIRPMVAPRPTAAVRSPPNLAPPAPVAEAVPEPRVPAIPAVREPTKPDPPPTAAPVPESEEVRLLEQAHIARQLRDVPRALQNLELYRAKFPKGVLRAEATLLEVEVRLSNNDELKALALLDESLPQQSSRRAEFSLVRSELLARLQRCEQALPGFNGLLEAPGALQERAWIGWATCQSATGQKAAAKEALTEYLRRFPRGAQRQAALELLNDD